MNKNVKDCIVSFNAHSDRIISCIVNLKNETIQVIQVYAPTSDYDNETIEGFYEDLEEAMDHKNNAHVIIMGDFNAKIGADNTGFEEIMGKHRLGTMNENGNIFRLAKTSR